MVEEQKVAANGRGHPSSGEHLKLVMKACIKLRSSNDDCFDPKKDPALRREVKAAAQGPDPGQLHRARSSPSQAGLQEMELSPTTPIGTARRI